MKKRLLSILLIISASGAFAWNMDALVSANASGGRSAAIAKNASVIYAAVSPAIPDPLNSVLVYVSTDGGTTWSPSGGGGPGNVSPTYIRTLKTLSDSVYCLYQVNNIVYVLNMETGTQNEFNILAVSDFDAAASTTYEAIYLYTITDGTTALRRFSTTDGGASWIGNILVASNAGTPKLCMHNGQLVLNYYGPLLANPAESIIRGVTYAETSAGVLDPGTFLDLATNTATTKNLYQSVIYNNTVWFFYTQTNASEDILCMVSQNGGASYNPPFAFATSAGSEYTFDATYYTTGSGGCDVALLNSDISGFSVIHRQATTTTPNTFTAATPVNDSPLTTTISFANDAPSVVRLPGTANAGIFWTGTQNGVTGQFYDSNAPVGITETENGNIKIFPNPASEYIYIETMNAGNLDEVILVDAGGRKVKHETIHRSVNTWMLPVNDLQNGIYILEIIQDGVSHRKKVAIR